MTDAPRETDVEYDPLLLAALAAGVPWWMAREAVATTRLSHTDDADCVGTFVVETRNPTDRPSGGLPGPLPPATAGDEVSILQHDEEDGDHD